MIGANFDADGTLIMTSSNCATIKRLVSIMNSGDKTGFVARLKTPVFSRHGCIFSRQDHISPVDEVGPDNNGSEIDVTESTGLDGTQTCGELSLMPGTSPEGAKLGRATCSSTHVAIDMSLKNNAGSLPLASQQNLPAEITSRCKQCEETFTISIGAAVLCTKGDEKTSPVYTMPMMKLIESTNLAEIFPRAALTPDFEKRSHHGP